MSERYFNACFYLLLLAPWEAFMHTVKLTEHFLSFGPQNPCIDIFELHKIYQSPDLEPLKL